MPPKKQQQVAPPILGTKITGSEKASPKVASTATFSTTSPVVTKTNANTDATAYSTIVNDVWSSYIRNTPQSLKIIDIFLAFLVFTGATQFAYCLLVGNYPFNAFLSGFAATVGQFVLAASLRSQCNIANAAEFPRITPERAFADFVVSSVILHFAVVNFLG